MIREFFPTKSSSMLRRAVRQFAVPPSHFSNPASVPSQFGVRAESQEPSHPIPTTQTYDQENEQTRERPLREVTSLLAMFVLGYLAIDNYTNRIRLEKLATETTAINLKTLQLQQQNFLNSRKQQELQILEERRNVAKRAFKMSLHIAMLRKQLSDLAVEPVDVDAAIKEFEKTVKISNSIQNVTGHAMWMEESSPLVPFRPDYREYDAKGRS